MKLDDAVAIGEGLGLEPDTLDALAALIARIESDPALKKLGEG